MNKLDPKFTESLVEWLRKDHTDENVVREGAMLLLQLNRNQGLYSNVMRNPLRMVKKLEYEIQKHVNYRLKGYTINDIIKLDNEVTPQVQQADEECEHARNIMDVQGIAEAANADLYPIPAESGTKVVTGKRPDHDKLPQDIQKIWTDNAERWKKIKETYNLLLTLNQPCDRFEHLQLLKEAWYKYKSEMCRYDDYRSSDQVKEDDEKKADAENTRKMIDYAHTFISKNLPVLMDLVEQAKDPDFKDQYKLEEKRTFIQNRVDILLQNGVTIGEDRKRDLIACDIRVELPTENAEGDQPE